MTGKCTRLCVHPEVEPCFLRDPAWQDAWRDYLDDDRDGETYDQGYERRIAARDRMAEIETAYGCGRRQ